MKKSRRKFSSSFKAQISTWKREFIENSSKAFDSKTKTEETDKEKSILYSKIGQLQVENDFLKKVLEK